MAVVQVHQFDCGIKQFIFAQALDGCSLCANDYATVTGNCFVHSCAGHVAFFSLDCLEDFLSGQIHVCKDFVSYPANVGNGGIHFIFAAKYFAIGVKHPIFFKNVVDASCNVLCRFTGELLTNVQDCSFLTSD